MGEYVFREEKCLSKEGWFGSCLVRGGCFKLMVIEKYFFWGFIEDL